MSVFSSTLRDTVSGFAPLLLVALGALATEYIAVLNIGLEGFIALGAFTWIASGILMGPVPAFFFTLALTAFMAWALDYYVQKARADAFVSGLGFNLLIPALVSAISWLLFSTKGIISAPALTMPMIAPQMESVPVLGALVFGQRWPVFIAFLSALIIIIYLAATPAGLRFRAMGIKPSSVEISGISLGRTRSLAWTLSGLAAGIAGMVMAQGLGAWVPGMSAGRGWVALVAVYLGGKKLGGVILASLAFAALAALSNAAQLFSFIPPELLLAMPYIFTAIAVLSIKGRK